MVSTAETAATTAPDTASADPTAAPAPDTSGDPATDVSPTVVGTVASTLDAAGHPTASAGPTTTALDPTGAGVPTTAPAAPTTLAPPTVGSAPPEPVVAATLVSCEGLNTGLVENPILPVRSCTSAAALVRSEHCCRDDFVDVDVSLIRDNQVVQTWTAVDEGPAASGYSLAALVDAGVPPADARALFDAAGGPCAVDQPCLDAEVWAGAVAMQQAVLAAARAGDVATLASLYLPDTATNGSLTPDQFSTIREATGLSCPQKYTLEPQPVYPLPGYDQVVFSLFCTVDGSLLYFTYRSVDGRWRILFTATDSGD